MKEINLNKVKIHDEFWSRYQDLIKKEVIPYQEKVLHDEMPGVEKSHAIENFRIAAGLSEGAFYGMVFQDSDVAKWLEGVAYSLAVSPDEGLEKRADAIIDIIAMAQQKDGYLNTYFSIREPKKRWTDLFESHELYCAGHMIEAAVAYYEVTGKDKLLNVMIRMADHIDARFGTEDGKVRGIPGHQEIELALMRLYRATGEERYKKLARYFLEERGRNPHFFAEEAKTKGFRIFEDTDPENAEYNQSHKTIYEQDEAVGHSVRAVYMYTAMADLAYEDQDEQLQAACDRLWDNITRERMYITGGIGATVEGEAFSIDYHLPNDTAYSETCAAIGLIFFARKMLLSHPDGKYADIMERALYNSVISGIQLDGKRFFYVNPLEVDPEISGKLFGYRHVLPERPGWYACACCPPNVVRLLMSLGKYCWDESEDTIYSHLFVGQEAKLEHADVTVESEYPWNGKVRYRITPHQEDPFTLAIHIPEHVKALAVTCNAEQQDIARNMKEGYLYLTRSWKTGDVVELSFTMPVKNMYANPKVREDAGCAAVRRGPFVYCFEGIDNGDCLQAMRLPEVLTEYKETIIAEGVLKGISKVEIPGWQLRESDQLYSEHPFEMDRKILQAIPYYAWGNRGKNQMRVWMNTR